jgi:tRNA(adenine34) deaminase
MSIFINNSFMLEALNQAKIAFSLQEVPVGCVIVENGIILAKTYNKTKSNFDPSAHCEILAIKEVCKNKKTTQLNNCDIYITLEPCPMCLMAINYAKIKRIYYGANDEKFGAIESNPIFKKTNITHFESEVYSGFYAQESISLLKEFFNNKR